VRALLVIFWGFFSLFVFHATHGRVSGWQRCHGTCGPVMDPDRLARKRFAGRGLFVTIHEVVVKTALL